MSKQKLELTWIGKDKRPKLEPRILLEDAEKSYCAKVRRQGDIFDNRLIFGDNLLALKALEQEFTGRVKCVFIDPPYNTGSAFAHYDDGLEHSIWLGLMRDRLELLKKLLSKDGLIWIQIDDEEQAYLKVLCDEIFGRKNFVTSVCVKMSHLSGVKMSHVEQGIPKLKEFILAYALDKQNICLNRVYEKANWFDVFDRYTQFLYRDKNNPEDISLWRVTPLKQAALENGVDISNENNFEEFCINNANNIFRTARNRSDAFRNLPDDNVFREINTATGLKKIAYKREEVIFTLDKCIEIDGKRVPVKPLGDIWGDIGINNLHNEGSVEFRNGKKPEKLIQRIILYSTNPGDLVLDSFAGSGTTGAVAHKMGRRWIMVELGEHCHTHIIPRLQKVIDGTDQGGISKAVGWQGGGGFRYFRLAPTLIINDAWNNPVINPAYNPEMLAEAIAKLQGFTYRPSQDFWWQHGYSSENDFIYVTTQTLNTAQLQAISDAVGTGRTLLICCAAWRGVTAEQASQRFPNLTLKKIPKVVLARCEWGHDDYSLNVAKLPMAKDTLPEEGLSETAAENVFPEKGLPEGQDLFGENDADK